MMHECLSAACTGTVATQSNTTIVVNANLTASRGLLLQLFSALNMTLRTTTRTVQNDHTDVCAVASEPAEHSPEQSSRQTRREVPVPSVHTHTHTHTRAGTCVEHNSACAHLRFAAERSELEVESAFRLARLSPQNLAAGDRTASSTVLSAFSTVLSIP